MSDDHDLDGLLNPEEIARIDENVAGLGQRVKSLANHVEQLEERVDQQQYVIDRLVTDLPTQKRSKREKLWAVIEHGLEHGKRTPRGVAIDKRQAAGAADCGPRHALNLFDDLDESYEWATKITTGGGEARLVIHDDGEPEAFWREVEAEFPEVDR